MVEKLIKLLMKVVDSEKLEVCLETLRDEIEGIDRGKWLSHVSSQKEKLSALMQDFLDLRDLDSAEAYRKCLETI